jgi:hypothetical protein
MLTGLAEREVGRIAAGSPQADRHEQHVTAIVAAVAYC